MYMFCVIYLVTFGMTSSTMYYYTKVMSELFLDSQFPETKNTFRGINHPFDFWRVSLLAREIIIIQIILPLLV